MAGQDREKVTPEMKVGEVLRRWPHLLEVFLEASPAFQKLKNLLFRRTMPNLVTVAQAERMGGLEPGALVARLNRALGVEGLPQAPPLEAESLLQAPPPLGFPPPWASTWTCAPSSRPAGSPFRPSWPRPRR